MPSPFDSMIVLCTVHNILLLLWMWPCNFPSFFLCSFHFIFNRIFHANRIIIVIVNIDDVNVLLAPEIWLQLALDAIKWVCHSLTRCIQILIILLSNRIKLNVWLSLTIKWKSFNVFDQFDLITFFSFSLSLPLFYLQRSRFTCVEWLWYWLCWWTGWIAEKMRHGQRTGFGTK